MQIITLNTQSRHTVHLYCISWLKIFNLRQQQTGNMPTFLTCAAGQHPVTVTQSTSSHMTATDPMPSDLHHRGTYLQQHTDTHKI